MYYWHISDTLFFAIVESQDSEQTCRLKSTYICNSIWIQGIDNFYRKYLKEI